MYPGLLSHSRLWFVVGFLVTITLVTFSFTPTIADARGGCGGGTGTSLMTLQVDQSPIQVFDTPSLKGKLVETLNPGQRLLWDGTVKTVEGRQWLKAACTGWTAPDSQILFNVDPNAVTIGITVGASGEIAQDIPAFTDKSLTTPAESAGKALILTTQTQFTVTDGPVNNGLFVAWQIKTANNPALWIPDIPGYLQITQPLTVYSYQVCDGFDLKTFGVTGWDSVVKQFPTLIAKSEQVQCLSSTNFKNDKTPVVVVLAHAESDTDRHDTLYLFGQSQGKWTTLYKETAEAYARTERIAMYKATTTNFPIVLWAIRNDGTGAYLRVEALQYSAASGVYPVLNVADLYKGNFEIRDQSITLLQAILKDGEANCCASGFNRQSYQWQDSANKFVKVIDDQPPPPYWLQGIPKQ